MKVLKISEHVYTASFSRSHPSYLTGFPQRETYLFADNTDIDVVWHRHGPLDRPDARCDAAVAVRRAAEGVDRIVFDNPISAHVLDPDLFRIATFDCCDWYLEYHDCEFGRDDGFELLAAGLDKAIAGCQSCIVQSETMRAWYLSRPGVAAQQCLTLPNGFDAARFHPGQSDIRFDRTTVLFAGKLGRWYRGLHQVVKALPTDWQLILVGDGPCRGEYEGLANVRCTGRLNLDEVADYVRGADICVMPVNDCSPIATSEYLACAKPVVHLGPRITWLIRDGDNGYIADASIDSWAGKLVEASEAPQDLTERAKETPRPWGRLREEATEWLHTI